MNFDIQTVLWIVLFFPSITLHEAAHAFAAYKLGDPTAKNAGRLTLNPLKHIDPFGTVLLPLLLFVAGGPIFGYAKPVPYNPRYFKHMQRGDLITGLAGPAANLSLALLGTLIGRGALLLAPALGRSVAYGFFMVGYTLTLTNLVLMFFNLLPIPPLDGSSIITFFLPTRALPTWYSIQRYSFVILFVLLWLLPDLLHVNPVGVYFNWTVEPVLRTLFRM